MIGVDKIGDIRRPYFEQHRPIKEIVRTLSVSRTTVRKVVRGKQTAFKYEREVQHAEARRLGRGSARDPREGRQPAQAGTPLKMPMPYPGMRALGNTRPTFRNRAPQRAGWDKEPVAGPG